MLITLFVMIILLILGITFLMGKGSSLIAGFNTMSEEEKAEIDERRLLKFMGKIMFALAGSVVFWLVGEWLEIELIFYVGLMIFVGIIFFMLIYTNKGKRFKRE